MKKPVLTLSVLAFWALSTASASAALDNTKAQELLKKGTCAACHNVDKKVVGPSFKEVAAKHKGQSDAVAKIEKVIRNGSKGAYGTVAMPGVAASKLSDAEAHDLAEWIMSK